MEKLFEKLNIKPNDRTIYKIAFSHSSYANEHKAKQDYERLEFLGDAILDMVISEYLYLNKREDEGEMTKVRSSYVCENALYEYATDLGISDYIKVGHGELLDDGKHKKTIVADIFEALIAAIYLDLGFTTVRRVILDIIVPYIKDQNVSFFNDYKSALQEYVQAEQDSISYELVSEDGPSHDREFTISVMIDGIVYGTGVGSSKKDAEQEAARIALEKVATN
jgi:ribonuclease-3